MPNASTVFEADAVGRQPPFAGKVALVVGGASGIGLATALRLAGEGAHVAIAGPDQDACDRAAAMVREAGRDALAIQIDLRVTADADRAVDIVRHAMSDLDVVVNCAGIDVISPLAETSDALWDEVQAVNLRGMFRLARAAVPSLTRRHGGAMVNVASIHSVTTAPGRAAYAASKAGLVGLTRALAVELGPSGIRVNAVAPGAIETDMLRAAWQRLWPSRPFEDIRDRVARRHPLRRIGSVDDAASAIVFLAGPGAAFITGQTILVDGGISCTLASLAIDDPPRNGDVDHTGAVDLTLYRGDRSKAD